MLQCSKLLQPTHTNRLENTMLNTEHFAASNKANYQVLMGLTAKAFEGVEQLTALHLQVVKASLDEASEAGMAALSAKDPQSLFALQAGLLQPAADKATAYGKQVVGIFTAIKSDFDKVGSQQAAAAQNSFAALIEAAGKNAPEGSANGIALFKSAMATANNAFDSLQKAGREASAAAEANYAAVTGSVAKAAGKSKRG
jgi:phasin family protein